jgi:hypothetical protein
MAKIDRSRAVIRKFDLNDPEQEYAPELANYSPGERIAMVFDCTRLCLSIQGVDWDAQRLQRDVVRVTRRGR